MSLRNKAREKQFVKRSRIIKEVTEHNQEAILNKILKKNNLKASNEKCAYEESKANSRTNSMIK